MCHMVWKFKIMHLHYFFVYDYLCLILRNLRLHHGSVSSYLWPYLLYLHYSRSLMLKQLLYCLFLFMILFMLLPHIEPHSGKKGRMYQENTSSQCYEVKYLLTVKNLFMSVSHQEELPWSIGGGVVCVHLLCNPLPNDLCSSPSQSVNYLCKL